MPIEITRIPVDALTCHECDCGACLAAAVTAVKAINGVVYVGIDRRQWEIVVRHDESLAGESDLRDAVLSSGLTIKPSET